MRAAGDARDYDVEIEAQRQMTIQGLVTRLHLQGWNEYDIWVLLKQ
jgi:hypothetical protein